MPDSTISSHNSAIFYYLFQVAMYRRDHIIALALERNNNLNESSLSTDRVTENLVTSMYQETSSQSRSSFTPPLITVPHITPPHVIPPHVTPSYVTPPHVTPPHVASPHVTPPTCLNVTPPRGTVPHVTAPQIHNTRSSLLCYENMPFEDNEFDLVDPYNCDSDDSVKDKDYVPETVKNNSRHLVNILDMEEVPEETGPDNTLENEPTTSSSTNDKGLTKSGVPRKRRKFDVPMSERLKMKKDSDEEKISIKPPCDEKCRRKCTSKINIEERQVIHDKYIKLNYESKGIYIKSMIETYTPLVRKVSNERRRANRDNSHRFYFAVNGTRIEVCKKYFLTTLGYHPNNNRRIITALNKEMDEQKDKRGSYKRTGVGYVDKDIVKVHIQNYNPMISHYRREHAPNRFYLPSDINITMMYQNLIEKYPDMKISFETYRKTVRNMNISFTHLGHEECEECALYKIHKDSSECNQEPCDKCVQHEKHNFRYTTTRIEYKKDVELSLIDKNHIYYSVDLQKVIMLPRIDQYKSAIFCPRIIAFNESFVPLGKSKDHENVPYAVLWNETISGRRQEDIISAFRTFFVSKRDAKEIFIWADNCAAQNKNWAFMCFLVHIVNSELISTETITIKYFEPGHTFMSADHFHHQVELSMKNKKIYDFEDFVDAVKKSNSNKNVVKTMLISDFYNYKDVSSQAKLKNLEPRVYLKDIMSIKAEKGDFTIKYKESHEGDWKTLDFLQVKIKKDKTFPEFPNKKSPRGTTKERKEEIISKLVPLMPENRRRFWIDLPVSNSDSGLD